MAIPGRGAAAITNLISRNSSKCLDVNGASTADGASIIQWSCNGGNNQDWQWVAVGSYYQLKARHSGKCLNVVGKLDGGRCIVGAEDVQQQHQQYAVDAPVKNAMILPVENIETPCHRGVSTLYKTREETWMFSKRWSNRKQALALGLTLALVVMQCPLMRSLRPAPGTME